VRSDHVCTYRLQLNQDFTFDDAAGIVDYLARLGISHLYLSPITQAAPGSMHGYDVCDPTRLSTDLGGPEAYERLCDALAAAGLGQVIDIVPNHMAFAVPQNSWLDDVLRNGPESEYASYFDLHWSEDNDGSSYVELPFLGTAYDDAISGSIRLVEADDGKRVEYGDFALPLRPGSEPASTNLTPAELDTLLRDQHYRLVYWRTADERLSYRRFFDITGLIGVRVEDETVFEDAHSLPLNLVNTGRVDGLRIDHIDGLRDPETYLQRLRDRAPQSRIVVEKILAPDENLPDAWPVDGTTGYDFLNVLNGLFVDPRGEEALTAFYAEFTGASTDYEAVLDESKRKVMQRLFPAELSQLADSLQALADDKWTADECETVLRETLVAFPVYRTYVRPGNAPSSGDIGIVEGAVEHVRGRLTAALYPLLDVLSNALLLRIDGERAVELAACFQQLSGPVMAKGAEDTAFYNYNRLVSLNEVGGGPSYFGASVDDFHAFSAETARRHPLTMLATATHDTKRGEDARLRIDALSQIPDEWASAVRRWASLNEPLRTDGLRDRNAEYLFYQMLVGAWPVTRERTWAYMLKAAREAKGLTSWREPDAAYEDALQRFVEGALDNKPFIVDLQSFRQRVVTLATPATLAQTLLKLTAPGVPDIYQGCELLDLSLVDPDNRRPVDYAMRREILETATRFETAAEVLAQDDPQITKLWITQRILHTRQQHLDGFSGDYTPLPVDDDDAVVAFMRGAEVVSVAKTRDGSSDGSLTLPHGSWRDVLSNHTVQGSTIALDDLLAELNVALLVKESA